MTQSLIIENSIASHSFYGVEYRPVTQYDIAISALNLKNPIFPINLYSKMPFQGRQWSKYHNWIHTLMELRDFLIQNENLWAPDDCDADINRWAISTHDIIVIDVDFQKDKNKRPVGYPQLGPIKQSWLDQASHKQKTQSTYQGQHTYHYIFKLHGRCYQLPKARLKNTTVDVIYGDKRLLILYELLPSKEVWDNLAIMPEELFRCIFNSDREVISDVIHIENKWKISNGKRNNELIKPIYQAFDDNVVIPILKVFYIAGVSDYPFSEMIASYNCIKNNHYNKLNINPKLLRSYYEEGKKSRKHN